MLPPAVSAFDRAAADFDHRFAAWRSVAAQRGAVRRALASAFPHGSRILEVGGGTGDDAVWLAARGYQVVLTDASPRMVEQSARKLHGRPGTRTLVAGAESLDALALDPAAPLGDVPFDGAFSNFAALNCVADLAVVGRGLARLVRPGGVVVLVLFGPCAPGEILVELARGRPRSAFRRLARGPAPARLGGHTFSVHYHRPGELARSLAPWFRTVRRRGIGILVPPSSAEPWISRYPRLLRTMELLDEWIAGPLALLGDHMLYEFERTGVMVPDTR